MCTKLNISNYNNIFILNHQILMQKSYSKSCDNDESYKLKDTLFDFIKKNVNNENSRKRKKSSNNKLNHDNPVKSNNNPLDSLQNFILEFSNEVKIIKEAVNSVLDKKQSFIKKFLELSPDYRYEEKLNLEVEYNNMFPNMYGDNQLNTFKIITLSDERYLIPPKSRYFNIRIEELNTNSFDKTFDIVVIDPPWRNKYIRRLKKSKFKSNCAYEMLYNEEIQNIPIEKLTNENSIVVIWCTNSQQHQNAILNGFLPKWKLKVITKCFWVKLCQNKHGNIEPISEFNIDFGKKQPFEIFYITCSINSKKDFSNINKINIILSIPSVIHSHKPPLLELLKNLLDNLLDVNESSCLELFARYLQPNFTSVGLEVLKLMNLKFYDFMVAKEC